MARPAEQRSDAHDVDGELVEVAVLRVHGLTTAQDVALGAVVVTGLASAVSGIGFAQQASGGAVPMESGSETAPEASPRAAKLKHVLNALGALSLVAEVALLFVNAVLAQRPRLRQPY